MTPRPQARKTTLGRLSPADPVPQQAPTAPEQVGEARTSPPAAPEPTGARPPAAAGERRKFRHKVSFYQAEEDTARVRAAILNTYPTEGPRSLSEFIHRAVMAEVQRLEDRYNGGEPWTGIGARELPQGRPMGH